MHGLLLCSPMQLSVPWLAHTQSCTFLSDGTQPVYQPAAHHYQLPQQAANHPNHLSWLAIQLTILHTVTHDHFCSINATLEQEIYYASYRHLQERIGFNTLNPSPQGKFPDPLPTEGLIMNRMAVLHQNWGASMQLDNFTIWQAILQKVHHRPTDTIFKSTVSKLSLIPPQNENLRTCISIACNTMQYHQYKTFDEVYWGPTDAIFTH